jgi:hypothetical protein
MKFGLCRYRDECFGVGLRIDNRDTFLAAGVAKSIVHVCISSIGKRSALFFYAIQLSRLDGDNKMPLPNAETAKPKAWGLFLEQSPN